MSFALGRRAAFGAAAGAATLAALSATSDRRSPAQAAAGPSAELVARASEWVAGRARGAAAAAAPSWTELLTATGRSNRRLLVVVNPDAGLGLAEEICDTVVLPMLRCVGFRWIEVAKYKEKGEVQDMLGDTDTDLDELDAVVVIGGDATVTEVFNGLALRQKLQLEQVLSGRPPKRLALEIPVGVVPAGSRNTLYGCAAEGGSRHGSMRSVGSDATAQKQEAVRAALAVARWDAHPMDLLECQLDDGSVTMVTGVGAKYAMEEAIARGAAGWPGTWFGALKPLQRYYAGKKAAVGFPWAGPSDYLMRVSILPVDAAPGGEPPSFAEWEEDEALWQTVEGPFYWVTAMPFEHGTGRIRTRSANLAWCYNSGDVESADLEVLQASALHVYEAQADASAVLTIADCSAFSIEIIDTKEAKRAWSLDGDLRSPSNAVLRGRMRKETGTLLL